MRRFDEHTQVAVFDGAVRITPASAPDSPGRVLQAGEQTGFSAAAVAPPTPVDEAFAAWTQGLLLADRMRPSCSATAAASCIATRRWPGCVSPAVIRWARAPKPGARW
ncbi:FecR family protein [Rubrivivax gelatinosus]|uniref:hypothetical protein n=1 Tax=Rubrivivax gelatinosus TaxID=28068 RepID=UPI003211B227